MNNNIIEFGLENVHYAKLKYNQTTNKTEYAIPQKILGAVNLSLNVSENTNTFYADNKPYYISNSFQGYSGSLTIAKPSDDFEQEILGIEKDKNGNYIEKSTSLKSEIALGFEIKGDLEEKRIWLLRVNLKRPNQTHNTQTENVNPDTYTFELNALPRIEDNVIKIKTTKKANENNYNNYFSQVPKLEKEEKNEDE
ncbi:major tail protein [Spiroplasma phoeniceum]|uniref:Uncharacterized protein n=1 Tax=Spiroplasma phoeniceum P40 TaxID=1276259 RepID=A0A345DLZ0_9MOLU|nr:major tail protein [Spiroplasma phoeniceum]AXF95228.1 hypothetical protein SDAV_00233 [Spiroplasma phoeniceum P40]